MRKLVALVVAIAFLAALSACGGDDDDSTLSGTGTSAPATEDDDMDMDMGDDESFAFGDPADAADADRTIDVDMFDDFTYEPDAIDVAVGETVTFQLSNSGKVVHEFVIGDEAVQDEHEQEMEEQGGDMMMTDEPNGVAVEPGDTKTLTFRFTEAAELEYACHQPGHYDAGMFAPLTVS